MKVPNATITTLEGIKAFFDEEITNIDNFANDELLARIFGVILYFNSLSENQKLGVFDRIIKYLKKLKEKLDQIAKEWGVKTYSIEARTPLGINVKLTFEH